MRTPLKGFLWIQNIHNDVHFLVACQCSVVVCYAYCIYWLLSVANKFSLSLIVHLLKNASWSKQ
jgi:hypothetical protein